MKISRRKSDLIVSSLAVALVACGAAPEIASPGELELGELKQAITIPGKGTATTTISAPGASSGSATRAMVPAMFGDSSGIPSGLSNAVACSTGTLSLANGGDSVTLKDSGGNAMAGFNYPSSLANSDGVSMNLNPDGSVTGVFVKHDTLSVLSRSAGKRASGASW